MIVWMAIWNRLYTKEKLSKFGAVSDDSCVFCNFDIESHDHLFFACPFSARIWRAIKNKCNVSWEERPWDEWVSFCADELKGRAWGVTLGNLHSLFLSTPSGGRGTIEFLGRSLNLKRLSSLILLTL